MNKIPLGSIPVPYDLTGTKDIYSNKKTIKIEFTCLTKENENIDLQKIKDNFMQKYGPLHIFYKSKGSYDFTMTITDKEK